MPEPALPSTPPAEVAVQVELTVLGARLRGEARVPAGVTPVGELMPVFRMVTEGIVHVSVMSNEQHGTPISCRKGCAACCRQMVPLSTTEARNIARLVETLPEPRRSIVLRRFADAEARLEEAGLLPRLLDSEPFEPKELEAVGMPYFRLGIPCPFLEDESCGIYGERPLRCREYIVVSDPENCKHPDEGVELVGIPLKPSVALCRLDGTLPGKRYVKVVALTMALRYARENAEPAPTGTGPELTRRFLDFLEHTRHPKPASAQQPFTTPAAATPEQTGSLPA